MIPPVKALRKEKITATLVERVQVILQGRTIVMVIRKVETLVKALQSLNLIQILMEILLESLLRQMGQKVLQTRIRKERIQVIQKGALLIIRKALVHLSSRGAVIAKDNLIVRVHPKELLREFLNPIRKSISISVLRNGSSIVMKSYFHVWTMVGARDSICRRSM